MRCKASAIITPRKMNTRLPFAALTFLFVALQSVPVTVLAQTCRYSPPYAACSSNLDCGCLPYLSSTDQSGICAYLYLNESKLMTCNEINYRCSQPGTVCVRHPKLSMDQSVCYPTGLATKELCPPLTTLSTSSSAPALTGEIICANASWAKRSVTVAGSNFSGAGLNQLQNPTAIVIDAKTDTLYVSDNGNARIVAWQPNAQRGTVVAGNNGQGNRTDQLGWVSDMLLDDSDGSLVICDARNRRVIRWPRHAQEGKVLIDNLYCVGLALDDRGFLYVSEHDNHRVTRWALGENVARTQVVAGGNGRGNRLDQLYEPTGVFVDRDRTLYVADFSNDRIMKWPESATEGVVLGRLRWPRAVHVDRSGNVYSIDTYYSRVVRWTSTDLNGTIIIGEQQYTLSQPTDLAFDPKGNIFVSNHGNGRVYKFDIDRTNCS